MITKQHRTLRELFDKMFPTFHVERWWPKKDDCIRVRIRFYSTPDTYNIQDLMFTYKNAAYWALETVPSYDERHAAK